MQGHWELELILFGACKRELRKMHHPTWLCGLHSLTQCVPWWSRAWTAGSIGCIDLAAVYSCLETTAMACRLQPIHGPPLQGSFPNSVTAKQSRAQGETDSCWRTTNFYQHFWDSHSMVSWPCSPPHPCWRESSKWSTLACQNWARSPRLHKGNLLQTALLPGSFAWRWQKATAFAEVSRRFRHLAHTPGPLHVQPRSVDELHHLVENVTNVTNHRLTLIRS